jgi:hypothetical protein
MVSPSLLIIECVIVIVDIKLLLMICILKFITGMSVLRHHELVSALLHHYLIILLFALIVRWLLDYRPSERSIDCWLLLLLGLSWLAGEDLVVTQSC